jgi:predicted Zn-dependent peptidase
MNLKTSTLANGLRVASIRLAGFRTAFVGAFVRVGSRYEPDHLNGISHFLEHMAFKGTRRRNAFGIALEAERAGAYMNAYTAKDHTAYYMLLPGENLATAVGLIADVVRESTFPREELERERNVILQEISEADDDPTDLAQDELDRCAFPQHALGRPILGHRKVIRTVRRSELTRYLRGHHTGANMVVVAAGGVDHAKFRDLAEKHFGDLERGDASTSEPAQYVGGFRHLKDDFGQTSIAIGWPTPARSDPRFPHYELLAELAGGGMSSPLFQLLRERHGLVYAVSASAEAFEDCGLFQVSAGVSPRDVGTSLKLVSEALVALADRIEPVDLERARNQFRAHHYAQLERPRPLAEQVAQDLLFRGEVTSVAERVRRAEAARPEALRDAMRAMLAAPPALAIVGRAGRGNHYDRLREHLARGPAAATARARTKRTGARLH